MATPPKLLGIDFTEVWSLPLFHKPGPVARQPLSKGSIYADLTVSLNGVCVTPPHEHNGGGLSLIDIGSSRKPWATSC